MSLPGCRSTEYRVIFPLLVITLKIPIATINRGYISRIYKSRAFAHIKETCFELRNYFIFLFLRNHLLALLFLFTEHYIRNDEYIANEPFRANR